MRAPPEPVAAAWTGKPLFALDGHELSVGDSLTGAGETQVGEIELRYVVQSCDRVDASSLEDDGTSTPPFPTLAFDGTASDPKTQASYATEGTLSFALHRWTYHPCSSFLLICV